jgi:ABC-type sugar transport system ATPase subunit
MRDGLLQQLDTPQTLYDRPANLFVAGFIGTPAMNFMEGRMEHANTFVAEGARVTLRREATVAPNGAVTLGIRPEDLVLQPDATDAPADTLLGRVVLVERLGGTSHIHFDVGANRLMAASTNDALPNVDEVITVRVRAERAHLFGADGRALR